MGNFKTFAVLGRTGATRPGWVALPLLLALAGCGSNDSEKPYAGELSPVKGQVLLASGKPVTGGQVVFIPKELGKPGAKGDITADGSFSMKMSDGREGAAPGEYKVRIDPSADLRGPGPGGKPKALPFPASYTDIDGDTGLTATVKAEATTLPPFELVAKGSASKGRDRD